MHPPYAVCLFVLYKLRYKLYIFTGYRCVLLRYPILARAKNGVFCNVTTPAPPRVGKTVGRRIILSPDMARMTRPCSGKRRYLTQNARQGYPKATVGDVGSYADNSNCRILQKMHGAPHGAHCCMAENRSSASPRCIPEKITFELAMDTANKRARALFARALSLSHASVRCVCYLRLPPPSPGRRELPPRLPPRPLP